MIEITIDNEKIKVESGTLILQACQKLGIEIPIFCYHEKLSIAGNCRMCLVEVEGNPKPVASCSVPCTEGMKIKTTTNMVKEAKNALAGSLIKIASVATSFPSGMSTLKSKIQEVNRVVKDGADEVDMVISRGKFLGGEYNYVFDEPISSKKSSEFFGLNKGVGCVFS